MAVAAPQDNSHSPVPRVLVVDDEEGIRTMLITHLGRAGYAVEAAACPATAYRLLERQQFDTILTDVAMPGEDGITFLSRLHETLPQVPVIIMTGYAQLQMAIDAIKAGAFDFIHKPFDFDHLSTIIGKAVEFASLKRLEANYLAELEKVVTLRTQELKQALTELDSSRAALLKAAQEKADFMSTITHEMRTPMNGVMGALDLLADEELTGEQREYVQLARQASDNMVDLIDRLLNFSDNLGRSPMTHHEEVSLAAVVASVSEAHRQRLTSKGVRFSAELIQPLPERIRSDAEQLKRLLDILLGNACKFTPSGSVRLKVSSDMAVGDRAALRFSVTDTGIGIPAEMLERIFEPFMQVDRSLTRQYGGAGLGLSIARQIALLLNGDILVESTPGQGSTFTFVMKLDAK